MIYITVLMVEGESITDYRGRRELFYKEVWWPSAPIPDNHDVRVSLGLDEEGKETGWSLVPKYVWYESNGDINVSLEAWFHPSDPEETIDKYISYLRNDEFLTYDQWKSLHG